jgi:hypothetical protein
VLDANTSKQWRIQDPILVGGAQLLLPPPLSSLFLLLPPSFILHPFHLCMEFVGGFGGFHGVHGVGGGGSSPPVGGSPLHPKFFLLWLCSTCVCRSFDRAEGVSPLAVCRCAFGKGRRRNPLPPCRPMMLTPTGALLGGVIRSPLRRLVLLCSCLRYIAHKVTLVAWVFADALPPYCLVADGGR